MARIAGRVLALGLPAPSEHFETDNVCTRHLARVLGLPPPGACFAFGASRARLRPLRRRQGAAAAAKSQAETRADGLKRTEFRGFSRTVAHGSEPLSGLAGWSDDGFTRRALQAAGAISRSDSMSRKSVIAPES